MSRNERTSEGYAPDGALDPDPVGKPNPEEIGPQIASMVIDRLRDGIQFPAEVNTIAGVIEWVNKDVSAVVSHRIETETAVLKVLVDGTGLNKDTKTLDDAVTWISEGFDELKRLQRIDTEAEKLMLSAAVEGDPPVAVSAIAAAAAGNAVNHICNELGLSSDIAGMSALVSSLKSSIHELKHLQLERESLKQIESAAEATRLYAAVEGGSAPPNGAPSTPYGEISGGPVSDMLSCLQESERINPDDHHSRDAVAIDEAHTQSFAENPPPTPVDETPGPPTPGQPTPDYAVYPYHTSATPAPHTLDQSIGLADAGQLSSCLSNLLTRILSDGMTSDLMKDVSAAFKRIQELENVSKAFDRYTPEIKKSETPVMATFIQDMLAQSDLDAPSAFDILAVCMEMAIFLMGKNKAYGDSALDPVRIISSADPAEQLRVRMDDKLSRLMRGHADGEDILKDLVGYWVLMRVAEKRAGG